MPVTRIALVALAVVLLGGASAQALRLPAAPKCPIFPPDNPWNQRVDRLPVAANSRTIIASIGADRPVHADFGSGLWNGGPIGIPVTVVGGRQPKVPVRFEHADESDRGPYPIPRDVAIEGGRAAEGDGVADEQHPVQDAVRDAVEAGETEATPAVALTGVFIAVAVVVGIVIAIAVTIALVAE